MLFNRDLQRLALTGCKGHLSVFFRWPCKTMAMLAIYMATFEHRKLLGMHTHKRHFKLIMLINYHNLKVLLLLLFMVCIDRVYWEVNCYETGPFFCSDIIGKQFPPKYITGPVQFCYFMALFSSVILFSEIDTKRLFFSLSVLLIYFFIFFFWNKIMNKQFLNNVSLV